MSALIATLRDDFEDNSTAVAWTAATTGSATAAETGGQARFTLPSSTAGTHVARYTSRSTYDLTGGSFFVTIGTMVATGVAATAFFQLYLSGTNTLQWIQLSGTLYARHIVNGVSTDVFSATWNATTYKYLRIRNSGANILWESSSNSTSWTTRATVAVGSLFAITSLSVDFGATCGNVASPGSFRLDDVNLILPALATTWRWQQGLWPLSERTKQITLAIDTAGTVQGYLVTADGVDVSGAPSGNVRYWSGPADGGRVLTEQASQAAAEAMAVDLPLDGRWDLGSQIEARCFRLYDRSVDGNSFVVREFYPRRLVQADDIEAESIRALHIASASITGDRIVAGTITADLISVTELEAISANMGDLHMTGAIDIASGGGIYQGSGSFATPTTGLKLYNSGGVGRLAGYNGGVEQIAIDTDGRLKAATGNFIADVNSVRILTDTTVADSRAYAFANSGGTIIGALYGTYNGGDSALLLSVEGLSGGDADIDIVAAGHTGAVGSVTLTASSNNGAASSSLTIFGSGLAGFTDDVGIAGALEVGGYPVAALNTWTPVLRGSGTAGTFTYTTQAGRYHQEGRLIVAHGRIVISAIGTPPTGNMQITGLPIAVLNSSAVGDVTLGLISQYNFSAGALGLTGLPTNNTTVINFFEVFDNAGTGNAPAAGINATFSISFTAFYTIA